MFGNAPVGGGAQSISIFNGRTGKFEGVHDATDSSSPKFIVPSDDEVVLFDSAYGGWDRPVVSTWTTVDHGGVALGAHQAAGILRPMANT